MLLQVNGRSVKEYGGAITKRGHIACKLPSWLHALSEKVNGALGKGFFKHAPEHVLINAYQPGMKHVRAGNMFLRTVCESHNAFASPGYQLSGSIISLTFSNRPLTGSR
jgi:hypothetical protein